MKIIHQVHPQDFINYNTQEIRDRFLLENLVKSDIIECVYTHYDRMIVGAACPVVQLLELETYDQLKSENFLDRREIAIVSIAGQGTVTADGEQYNMESLDCLYIGKGKKQVSFSSTDENQPAKFIFFSCPAHQTYPNHLMKPAEATPTTLGSLENNNERTINKYIHPDGIKSCQLMLGVTHFKKGSIWNTMPPHLHDRRMETYFYFNLPPEQRVIHFMGQPNETRHMFVANEQAILSPAWSMHFGCATSSYSFIWAMAGENMSFGDMDAVPLAGIS